MWPNTKTMVTIRQFASQLHKNLLNVPRVSLPTENTLQVHHFNFVVLRVGPGRLFLPILLFIYSPIFYLLFYFSVNQFIVHGGYRKNTKCLQYAHHNYYKHDKKFLPNIDILEWFSVAAVKKM